MLSLVWCDVWLALIFRLWTPNADVISVILAGQKFALMKIESTSNCIILVQCYISQVAEHYQYYYIHTLFGVISTNNEKCVI